MIDIIEPIALTKESLQIEDSDDLSSVTKSIDEVDNVGYRFESERLKSFSNWPVSYIEPEKLAASGFFYLGEIDKVRCFECSIEICQWVEGDDPMENHKLWSDRCRFVRKLPCGNVPIRVDTNPSTVPLERSSYDDYIPYESQPKQNTANNALTSTLQLLTTAKLSLMGLGRTKGPRYPDYASYDVRLKTFDTWPKSIPQTKEHLAHAGFYYTGKGDQTLCHDCGVGLKDWEPEDDPWKEHAKWFPKCFYLLMEKGREYVNIVTGQQVSAITTKEAVQIDLPSFIEKVEQSVDDERICKICYNGELGIVFLPCGHIVACVRCAPEMTTCAMCRKPVTDFIRVLF